MNIFLLCKEVFQMEQNVGAQYCAHNPLILLLNQKPIFHGTQKCTPVYYENMGLSCFVFTNLFSALFSLVIQNFVKEDICNLRILYRVI